MMMMLNWEIRNSYKKAALSQGNTARCSVFLPTPGDSLDCYYFTLITA